MTQEYPESGTEGDKSKRKNPNELEVMPFLYPRNHIFESCWRQIRGACDGKRVHNKGELWAVFIAVSYSYLSCSADARARVAAISFLKVGISLWEKSNSLPSQR